MRFFSIVRFYIVKNQGLSLHVPPARATSFNTNVRFVCTCYEFWQLFFIFFCWNCILPKLRKTCGLKTRSVPVSCWKHFHHLPFSLHEPWVLTVFLPRKSLLYLLSKLRKTSTFKSRSVPARAASFNTNERYVCTCCEFWQFQLLVLCWNSTFAKTQCSFV